MLESFRSFHYETEHEPIFSLEDFKSVVPITSLDCSVQKEAVQSSSVIVRIEFERSVNTTKNI